MNGPATDRNLLMGIVALQMDFIARDELIAGMHDWTLDKGRSLSEILVANGALDPADRLALESLVDRHIARHGGDPEKSLSSLDLIVPSRSTLEALDDPDIRESLSKLRVTHTHADQETDSETTGSWRPSDWDTEGRFRIISLHDEGGLGSVFLARDGEVNREVALKQMKEEVAGDPQLRARFIFEAEITGNLEHPGIVPVYGKGEYADGRPYYAMRFIRGETLKSAVDRFHNDPKLKSDSGARQHEFQKLVRRFLVVCETMAYTHSRGIIHRDLKPRNIMLGPYGETLVVDWGLAKVVGHRDVAAPSDETLRPPSGSDIQPTGAGSQVGTPGYMSPEQARGEIERLGPAADIYSLGATLYYMLTKQPAFADKNNPEVLLKIERGEFAPPREVKPGVDRALEAICLKAMKTRPRDRYDSCRALADDLEHWLADQPVRAYPEPLSRKATRWLRRRKQLVLAATVALVLGLVGLGIHDLRITSEKNRTSGQLAMTRDGLRELLSVAGESLARYPGSGPLRSNLASRVLGNYKQLLEAYPSDPDVRVEIAQVYDVIGGLARVTGQYSDSRSAYINAMEALDALPSNQARPRAEPELRIRVHINRGELFHMSGRLVLAQQDFDRASSLLENGKTRLAAPTYRKLLASVLINRSEVFVLAGKFDRARSDADAAVKLLLAPDKAATAVDPDPELRLLLAMSLTDRGSASALLGNSRSAHDDFRDALNLVQEFPAGTNYEVDAKAQVGTIFTQLGDNLSKETPGSLEAQQCLDQAIAALRPLADQFRHYTVFRKGLTEALSVRSRLLMDGSRWDDRQKDCHAARAMAVELLRASPDNAEFISLLARTFDNERRFQIHAGAAQIADALRAKCIEKLEQAIAIDSERVLDRQMLERVSKEAISATAIGGR